MAFYIQIIGLVTILITNDRSYDIRDMLDKAVLGYKNCPYNSTKAEINIKKIN